MPYKDSLFRSIFGNGKAALTLYNAIHGTDYREQDTDVIINTLEGALFDMQKNDLSFLVNGRLVVLIEHQASINENMPFRFLHPVQRLFEDNVAKKKALYQKPLVKLPRPQFIVLYNGTEDYPNEVVLRLSDAFEKVEGFEETLLELVVTVYNINEGRNTEMAGRCEELRCYSFFVDRERYHEDVGRKRDPSMDKKAITRIALRKAIQDCKDRSLLVDFWENLSPEDINMLGSDWDMNLAMEAEREDGILKGIKKTARNALAEGLSIETIQKITGLDLEAIKRLQEELNSGSN